MIKPILRTIALSLFASYSFAAPIDLSSWNQLTLNYPGGQPAGNWILSASNTTVTQTVNADPSFYLNSLNQTSFSMDGTWQVKESGGDDDYMGFVFGYQNSSNFYLFDWKQASQSYVGTMAAEGMSIKKFQGATGNGLTDLSLEELWENEHDYGDMDVLATNHSSSAGWLDNRIYNFHLDFNLTPGDIRIIVEDSVTLATLWDVSINDNTFASGQFGFYNYSQQSVEYAGFEQEGGVIVETPEPSGLVLLVLSMMGLGYCRHLRCKQQG